MTNCVQLLQHVDLLHADGGLGFQKEFDYIQAATVEKKGSYDDDDGDCGDGDDDGDDDGKGHLVTVSACCSSGIIRQE